MFSRFGNRRSSFFAIRFDSIRFDPIRSDSIRVGELHNARFELFFLKTGKNYSFEKKIDLDFVKEVRYKMLFHDFRILMQRDIRFIM